METSSKHSLSLCQVDEPASDEFCSIIRLSIQFILDELSVWDRQFVSSINSAVQVTFHCITGRCFWLFTIRIPVTANPQQTNQVTFSVRDTTTRDCYPKCKLKYNYEENDFTGIRNSTLGGFNTGLRSHRKFRLFACKQSILSCCFCCRLFVLSSYQKNIIHYIKLMWKSPSPM